MLRAEVSRLQATALAERSAAADEHASMKRELAELKLIYSISKDKKRLGSLFGTVGDSEDDDTTGHAGPARLKSRH